MSPIEDLHSRDLAWISDFVMQQMVIMLRPMMDHLHHTDSAVDFAQRQVQRLSIDMSEVRGDMERTNKYLAILRQGLGVQSEGKCMLQRGLESTARTAKRLDDQLEGVLLVIRGVEESIAQLSAENRGTCLAQEDLARRVVENASAVEALQTHVERVSSDAHGVKEDLLNGEARLEAWQRELRELRRTHLGVAPKLEDKCVKGPPAATGMSRAAAESWHQKKSFNPLEVTAGTNSGANGGGESGNARNGSGNQQQRRLSRLGSSSSRPLLQVYSSEGDGPVVCSTSGLEDAHDASHLPMLAKSASITRTTTDGGPRLRFTATMPKAGAP